MLGAHNHGGGTATVAPSGTRRQNSIWWDSTYGVDATGLADNHEFPFKTKAAALAAMAAGDKLYISPGDYTGQTLNPGFDIYVEARGAVGFDFDFTNGRIYGIVGNTIWHAQGAIQYPTSDTTKNGTELRTNWDAAKTTPSLSAIDPFVYFAKAGQYANGSNSLTVDTDFMTLQGEGNLRYLKNWFHGIAGTPAVVIPTETPATNITVTPDFSGAIVVTKSKVGLKNISLPTVHTIATQNITFTDGAGKGEGFVMRDIFSPVHVQSSNGLRLSSDFTGKSSIQDCWFASHDGSSLLAGVDMSSGDDWGGNWDRVIAQSVPGTTFVGNFDNGIYSFNTITTAGMFGTVTNSVIMVEILDAPGTIEDCIHTSVKGISTSGHWNRGWFTFNACQASIISGTLSNGENLSGNAFVLGELTLTGVVNNFYSPIAAWMANGTVKSLGMFIRSQIGSPPNSGGFSAHNSAVKLINCDTEDIPVANSQGAAHPFEGDMDGGSFGGFLCAVGCRLNGVRWTGKNRTPKPTGSSSTGFVPSWILPPGHWGGLSNSFSPQISVPVADTYRLNFQNNVGNAIFGVGKSFVFEGYTGFPGLNGTHTIAAVTGSVDTIDISVIGAALNTLGALSGADITGNVLTLTFAAPHGINGGRLDVSGIGFVTSDPNSTIRIFSAPTTTTLTASFIVPNETFTIGGETVIQTGMHTLDNAEIYQIGFDVDITNCEWEGEAVNTLTGAAAHTSDQIIHKSLSIKTPRLFSDDSITHGCSRVQTVDVDHQAHYAQDIIHMDTSGGNRVVTCKPEDEHRTFAVRKTTGDANTVRVNNDAGTQIGDLIAGEDEVNEYYTDETTILAR